jgi:two-component system, NarL family, invasion response regulator UvrY
MHTIGLVDDHTLIRKGLIEMIDNTGKAKVIFEGDNGSDLVNYLRSSSAPDIILLDISMPIMNGFETAIFLHEHYPLLDFVALSMMDEEEAIIRMVTNGAKGYLLKNITPNELLNAIDTIKKEGIYLNNLVNNRMVNALRKEIQLSNSKPQLTDREIEYIKLTCEELSHKEIAEKLFVSPRTVDYYRDGLFEKLHIKTRVGLVLFALKHKLFQLK